jgi:succinate dehydrogenase assembly factor 1
MSSRVLRHSGLQKKVLTLFRDCLRAARRLPDISSQAAVRQRCVESFREKGKTVDRLDIQRIEHLLRQARKELERLEMPGVSGYNTIVTTR